MRGRKKKDAPESRPAATPFFARYLEDQHAGDEDAEAEVTEPRRTEPFTYKERGAAKSAKGAKYVTKSAAKSAAAKSAAAQTLKYPSDRDEWVLYPYHAEAATAKAGSTRQTLKYPSDRDEIDAYFPVYADAADAPKAASASAKPKKNATVRLTTKAADGDEVTS